MANHIVGRESSILEEIRAGRKTVEARLAKPRFRKFRPGDRIRIREDFWDKGTVVKSKLSNVRTGVIRVEYFPNFRSLLTQVGYKNVNPATNDFEAALSEMYRFYNKEDEVKLGVVAIYFNLLGK